jgi:hypothetical protein
MSEQIYERGAITLTRCAARCDACRQVGRAIQITGPNGYVTLCDACSGNSGNVEAAMTWIIPLPTQSRP